MRNLREKRVMDGGVGWGGGGRGGVRNMDEGVDMMESGIYG